MLADVCKLFWCQKSNKKDAGKESQRKQRAPVNLRKYKKADSCLFRLQLKNFEINNL